MECVRLQILFGPVEMVMSWNCLHLNLLLQINTLSGAQKILMGISS
jgi:hypothetical protein